MTDIMWLVVLAPFVVGNVYQMWWARRHLRRCGGRVIGWEAEEKARRAARWVPEPQTGGTSVSIKLQRVAVTPSGRKVLNSISVGSVSTHLPGWEKGLEELVVSARARAASLNALADASDGLSSHAGG